jgi:hypothetical protein
VINARVRRGTEGTESADALRPQPRTRGAVPDRKHCRVMDGPGAGRGSRRFAGQSKGTEPMRTNAMNSNVTLAIGVVLREQYGDSLKEAIPTHLMDLLVRLSQRSSLVSEVANRAKCLPAPLSVVTAKYNRAIEEAAQCMVTVARVEQFATAAQAWMFEALRLRGGLTAGNAVDRVVLQSVLKDVVELAVTKSIKELLPDAGQRCGDAPLAEGLRQNLYRLAERFPVGRLAA